MNPRITLIVVAVFALLLGYVYFVEINKTPAELGTPVPTPQSQVFTLDSTKVKSIQVRDLHSTRVVELTRSDSSWQVQSPQSKPADTQTVDSALAGFTFLQATRVLTNATDLKAFGLTTAAYEIRLVMTDTVPYALTVGDKTPDGSGYYAVYTGNESKVFIIGTSAITGLTGWLDTPPYQPTPTPTATATPPSAPTPEGTPAAIPSATPTP